VDRTTLRERLLLRLGNRPDATTTLLDGWLNDGLLDLCTKRVMIRSLELGPITSVVPSASVSTYGIPTDPDNQPLLALTHIEQKDGPQPWNGEATRRLLPWEGALESMLDAIARREVQADDAPVRYIVYGTSFIVFPIPGTTKAADLSWEIYGHRRPFMGPNGNDSSNIEAEWHYAISLIAAEHAFRDLGDEERAQIATQEFKDWYEGRETARRVERRFNASKGGARPHPAYFSRRTGV